MPKKKKIVVTRIVESRTLTANKLSELRKIVAGLGKLRTEIWDRYGSVAGTAVDPIEIRNEWLRSGKQASYGVPTPIANETMRDAFAQIKASREAAFSFVIKDIYRKYKDKNERKEQLAKLKDGSWIQDSWLHRTVRKHWHRGHTSVDNQIVLNYQLYSWYEHKDYGYIKIACSRKYHRLAIPLNSNRKIEGTIRLILRDDHVEVHHTIEEQLKRKPAGTNIVGVDAGYTEALTDSNGNKYGKDLGKILTEISDKICEKGKNRNKLYSIMKKSDPAKAARIQKNNLGKKKQTSFRQRSKDTVRGIVFNATHRCYDKASHIVYEDLSHQFNSKNIFGKRMSRLLSGWMRSVLAEASEVVPRRRRGATSSSVNCAFTSQICHFCGNFGIRKCDEFYCEFCGVVLDADVNGAKNILARDSDSEITLWMKPYMVKSILQSRIRRSEENGPSWTPEL